MKITLRQLEVFTAVATHGQVTRAAQVISMTQAAASMALADLEQQLGISLFDRVGRQLLLNDTGRLLLMRARDVLDQVHDIEAIAHGQDSIFDLHLGASVTIGNHLLPGLVANLKHHFPNGQIQISRYNTEQVVAQLLAFRIDMGFIEGPIEDDRFRRFPWKQDQLIFFAAPQHALVGRLLTTADLSAADWIVREHGSGTRQVLDQACLSCGVRPRIVLELEQPEAIRQCVKAGLGIGCLSELELEDAFRAGSLVPLSVPFLDMRRNLDVVIHRHKFISRGIAAILGECGIIPGDQVS
ncbi:MAG: LysR family transcriptional regulator [Formivibrio sp.]|nr:LysR family transcriptional regulator [Formivibrio sp.]